MFRVQGVGAGGDFLTRTQEVLAVKEHPETRPSIRGAAVGEDRSGRGGAVLSAHLRQRVTRG